MKSTQYWFTAALVAMTTSSWLIVAQAAAPASPIAGLAPYQRMADAPRLTADPVLDKKQALHGVSEPIAPNLLKLLDQQGGWFNPFTQPGMTAPYDLRGWHTTPSEKAK